MVEDKSITKRMDVLEQLIHRLGGVRGSADNDDVRERHEIINEICILANSILADTVGERHILWGAFRKAEAHMDADVILPAWRSLKLLRELGALRSPVLRVAQELEGEILEVAESQVRAAESSADARTSQMRLAVAAFLAGAALEDALRRLCDKNGVEYEAGHTSIDRLRAALRSPAKGIEFITLAEDKLIISWGGTRNDADHGNFDKLLSGDVGRMVLGIRDFIARVLA